MGEQPQPTPAQVAAQHRQRRQAADLTPLPSRYRAHQLAHVVEQLTEHNRRLRAEVARARELLSESGHNLHDLRKARELRKENRNLRSRLRKYEPSTEQEKENDD